MNPETMCWNDNLVSLEKAVGLVAWESELIEILPQLDSIASSDLSPVLECGVVREGQFP